MKVYNKLVRDKIPEIIQKQGWTPVYHIMENQEEYKEEVKEKILEEVIELINAKTLRDILEEEGDLLEILNTFNNLNGIKFIDVIPSMGKKAEEKGVFEKRIYLERVE